jgi:probable rRNA maturation factor
MLKFSLQRAVFLKHQPTRVQFEKWVRHAVYKKYSTVVISLEIVDVLVSQQLNQHYRHQDKATNVISLEYAATRDEFSFLSGQLYLCDTIIVAEAQAMKKDILAHYAHMVIHGMLHLQGYDHQLQDQAQEMEQIEINLLKKLGYPDPYMESI